MRLQIREPTGLARWVRDGANVAEDIDTKWPVGEQTCFADEGASTLGSGAAKTKGAQRTRTGHRCRQRRGSPTGHRRLDDRYGDSEFREQVS